MSASGVDRSGSGDSDSRPIDPQAQRGRVVSSWQVRDLLIPEVDRPAGAAPVNTTHIRDSCFFYDCYAVV
jgi:hypothetical protein